MVRKIAAIALSVLGAASLNGCNPLIDAQMEEPEVCVTQNLHFPGAPIPGPSVTVTSNDKLSVPELPKEGGQTQLSETVKLTRGQLIAPPGSDLGFLSAFSITVPGLSQPLMSGQKQSTDRVITLDLATNDADLASLFTGNELMFSSSETGQISQQQSTVSLKTCLHAKAELGIQ